MCKNSINLMNRKTSKGVILSGLNNKTGNGWAQWKYQWCNFIPTYFIPVVSCNVAFHSFDMKFLISCQVICLAIVQINHLITAVQNPISNRDCIITRNWTWWTHYRWRLLWLLHDVSSAPGAVIAWITVHFTTTSHFLNLQRLKLPV